MAIPYAFSGNIPALYDACLGPLFFEFSAADLAERVGAAVTSGRLLELACGTGISTEFLRKRLPAAVSIAATDINPAMLGFAREHRGSLDGVTFDIADALDLPHDDDSFDAVVCQFGIMFFPDLAQGLEQMRRVLRPGGVVACNVWDGFSSNPIAALAFETIGAFFDDEPPRFLEVPFGNCPLEPTLGLFRAAGFEGMEGHIVEATVETSVPHDVARGLVEGNPGIAEIHARASAKPEAIVAAVEAALIREFGPTPLRIPMCEIVYTGTAP
ncbi:MAG: methyltransferase domain-containing protein [Deltaproteobacteria bacterium]|nr:methyltransferase domain-containing protein [Deltaproteobacteria bacterium]